MQAAQHDVLRTVRRCLSGQKNYSYECLQLQQLLVATTGSYLAPQVVCVTLLFISFRGQ